MSNNNDWEKRTKVGRVGLVDQGEYDPNYPGGYALLDMVTKDGIIWMSLVADNTDPIPADGQDTDKWKMRFRSVYEAETARGEAEAEREAAEAERKEAENQRRSEFEAAEAERKDAEDQRKVREAAREAAETERNIAEDQRKDEFAHMEETVKTLSMLTEDDVNEIFNEQ